MIDRDIDIDVDGDINMDIYMAISVCLSVCNINKHNAELQYKPHAYNCSLRSKVPF